MRRREPDFADEGVGEEGEGADVERTERDGDGERDRGGEEDLVSFVIVGE